MIVGGTLIGPAPGRPSGIGNGPATSGPDDGITAPIDGPGPPIGPPIDGPPFDIAPWGIAPCGVGIGPGGMPDGGGVIAPRALPQLRQNFMPGGFSPRQTEHVLGNP